MKKIIKIENKNKKGGEKMRERIEKIKQFVEEIKKYPVWSARIKGLDWESRKEMLEGSSIVFRFSFDEFSEKSIWLRVVIAGKTYPVKDTIKSFGGFYWTGTAWEKSYNITTLEKMLPAFDEIKELIKKVLKAQEE